MDNILQPFWEWAIPIEWRAKWRKSWRDEWQYTEPTPEKEEVLQAVAQSLGLSTYAELVRSEDHPDFDIELEWRLSRAWQESDDHY